MVADLIRPAPGGHRRARPTPRAWTLADDVVAPLSLPGFDNSAMDGYAVVADDVAGAARDTPCCCRSPRTSRPAAPTS